MLNSISNELDLRITELRKMLDIMKKASTMGEINGVENANKGLLFVNIYSILEFVIVDCVAQTINIINNEEVAYKNVTDVFKGIAIQGKLQAYSDAGFSKKWDKTWLITEAWDSEEIVRVSNTLLPSDGSNFREKQVKSIFKSFGIELKTPNFIDIHSKRLNEITEARNAISHGRIRASEIGRNCTFDDLLIKINEIHEFLSFIIIAFSDYLESKKYLKN